MAKDKPGITQRLLSRFGYVKEYTLDQLFDVASNPFRYGNRLRNQQEQLKAYVDWVYAASSAIAQEAAAIDLRAYANRSKVSNAKVAKRLAVNPRSLKELMERTVINRYGEQRRALEELEHHIVLDLLDKPNPVQEGDSFKEMIFLHLLLAGEAFIYEAKNGLGKPQELWPIMPYMMKEKVADRRIVEWEYRNGAETLSFDPSEIIHFKLTDPNNIYRGMGVVKAAARAINTGAAASDWNERFFLNSARPDLALETDSSLSDTTYERLKQEWDDNYRGTDKSHKVAILEQGLKLNRITTTQKEMDFLKSMAFNRDQVLAMFKTSRTMLGIIEGDGRANMEAAEYNQAKRVIRPLFMRFVASLNSYLAPDYDSKLVLGFTDPVPEDKEFAHKVRTEGINKYLTVNEAREEIGLEPIDGGDVIYQRPDLVPLGTPAPKPDEEPEPDDDPPNDPPEDDETASKQMRKKGGLSTATKPSVTS